MNNLITNRARLVGDQSRAKRGSHIGMPLSFEGGLGFLQDPGGFGGPAKGVVPHCGSLFQAVQNGNGARVA